MRRTAIALIAAVIPMLVHAAPPFTKPVEVEVINPVLPVEVSNAEPIPVGVASLPLKPSEVPANRYQITLAVDAWRDSTVGSSLIQISGSGLSIPDDKILVLEFVYAQARVNPGDKAFLEITCQGAASTIGAANVTMPLAATGIFGAREFLVGGGPVKCYSGSSMIVTLVRDSAIPAGLTRSGQVSLIGYLMDEPQ
jgi:hypothetical protein